MEGRPTGEPNQGNQNGKEKHKSKIKWERTNLKPKTMTERPS